jgi:hypothetical protein
MWTWYLAQLLRWNETRKYWFAFRYLDVYAREKWRTLQRKRFYLQSLHLSSYTYNTKSDFGQRISSFKTHGPWCALVLVWHSFASKEINRGSALETGVETFSPAAYPAQLLGLFSTPQRQSVRIVFRAVWALNVAMEWVAALLLRTQVFESRAGDGLSWVLSAICQFFQTGYNRPNYIGY